MFGGISKVQFETFFDAPQMTSTKTLWSKELLACHGYLHILSAGSNYATSGMQWACFVLFTLSLFLGTGGSAGRGGPVNSGPELFGSSDKCWWFRPQAIFLESFADQCHYSCNLLWTWVFDGFQHQLCITRFIVCQLRPVYDLLSIVKGLWAKLWPKSTLQPDTAVKQTLRRFSEIWDFQVNAM